MGIFTGLKEKFDDLMKKKMESMKFKKAVEDEILPIRRKAYLEEKKKTAVEEGKIIARKEFEAKKPNGNKSIEDTFGLGDPLKFIRASQDRVKLEEKKKNGS